MERDFKKAPLSASELDEIIGARDYREFVATRSPTFRSSGLDKNALPPRKQMLALMAKESNLVRRPLLIVGDEVVLGTNEERYRTLAKKK